MSEGPPLCAAEVCNVTTSAAAELIGNETLLAGAAAGLPLVLQDNCICEPAETALSTKIVYALWVWSIFLTFPGTFSMQPAVTTQTFGHK